ncbi:MAG: hypothetical protein IPM01_23480 [Burkholderiaceae bacterium]|nr:hypothetical protein [Burkholderiaceae bacterium]
MRPSNRMLAIALTTLAACGGSSDRFEPPATLALPADLVPAAQTLFFNRGPSPFNPKYGGSTVREWLILDPDGGAIGRRSADDGRQLTPIGQWRVSDERLIVEQPQAPAQSFELNWETAAGLRLQARPGADPGFFARRWVGDQTVTLPGMPGRFADGLAALERACPGVSDPVDAAPWWAGSLDLGRDGRYRASLQLMRSCAPGSGAVAVDSGHPLARLRAGSWRITGAGRQLEFAEAGGERLLMRLDGLAAPQAGWAGICLEGALLGSAAAPAEVEGLLTPRSAAPVRGNLPLVLEEADGCLPARLKTPLAPVAVSLELHVDGLALADGLGDRAADVATWRLDGQTLTLRSAPGETLATASMRWQSLNGEPGRRRRSDRRLVGSQLPGDRLLQEPACSTPTGRGRVSSRPRHWTDTSGDAGADAADPVRRRLSGAGAGSRGPVRSETAGCSRCGRPSRRQAARWRQTAWARRRRACRSMARSS